MAIFVKLIDVVKSNINDLLDRAEDPEKMLPMLIGEMEEHFREAKAQVAQAVADQKNLESKIQTNLAQAADWRKKAMLAVDKGDDALAKEALGKKNGFEAVAAGLKEQVAEQTAMVGKLKAQLAQLEEKISDAKQKKDALMARARRANAQEKIQETMQELSDSSSLSKFGRMEEKVSAREARGEALEEMNDETTDAKFEALEREQKSVALDDDLAALKAQMMKDKSEA